MKLALFSDVLGDQDRTEGLPDRAKEAFKPAKLAHEILVAVLGPRADDTLAAHADWIRFKQLGGDPSVIGDWISFFAVASDYNETEFVDRFSAMIKVCASLVSSGKMPEAKQKAREFLAPLLSDKLPRIRGRMPWSLAQASQELDTFGLSQLCWPVPTACMRLPIDLKLCDEHLRAFSSWTSSASPN